ncbi:MAG TPA: hypothetical protein VMC41_03255 [Candidatus Nanoarchaeia archaeon]|nr:hypothetical protein [Candidatus Nanoarchaeia archaeon]
MSRESKESILFFAVVCLVILWQILWPGYILTLDTVFAPKLNLDYFFTSGNFFNSLPFVYFLKFFNLFLTGWVVEKILIISLFLSIGFLAYVYLPVPKKYYARYFAALFYLINPFVYERFLAGQWAVLFGYAFLPPFIAALIKFHRQPQWQNVFKLFGWLALINIFSLHLFVMSALMLAGYFVVSLFLTTLSHHPHTPPQAGRVLLGKGGENLTHPVSPGASHPSREGNNSQPPPNPSLKRRGEWIIKFLVGGLVFLVISSYWLVPYFVNQSSSDINNFDQSNWQAFATAGDKHLGTAFNVAALYGFWEEHENWAGYFLWPKDNYIFWLITAAALFVLIISGIIWGWKKKRKLVIALLLVGLGSFIFSCGVGETIFKNFNFFLFQHFNFWRGFRDSEKWTSYLVLVYAILAGWGVICLSELFQQKKYLKYFVWILMALAILGTYTELGGFARQLQPVWYPASWYKAKQILDQDKSDYRVLFLPWHMYLSLNFNHKLIMANPANQFFGPKIIESGNMEMPGASGNYLDQKFAALDKMISNGSSSSEAEMNILRENKIKYIIFLSDLSAVDKYRYDFIKLDEITPIFKENDLALFTVGAK